MLAHNVNFSLKDNSEQSITVLFDQLRDDRPRPRPLADAPQAFVVDIYHPDRARYVGSGKQTLIEIERVAAQPFERRGIDDADDEPYRDKRQRNEKGSRHPHRLILSARKDSGKRPGPARRELFPEK